MGSAAETRELEFPLSIQENMSNYGILGEESQ